MDFSKLYKFPPFANQTNANPLSNLFYTTDLFCIDGVWWTSVVQYYLAQKYIFDKEVYDLIIKENDTTKLLNMCRFKNLNNKKQRKWDTIKFSILKRGMYSKIEQNIQYFRMLMKLPDSAIESISDSVIVSVDHDDDVISMVNLSFEMEDLSKKTLFQIRDYYNKNGHPLLKNKQGDLKPNIVRIFNSYLIEDKTIDG